MQSKADRQYQFARRLGGQGMEFPDRLQCGLVEQGEPAALFDASGSDPALLVDQYKDLHLALLAAGDGFLRVEFALLMLFGELTADRCLPVFRPLLRRALPGRGGFFGGARRRCRRSGRCLRPVEGQWRSGWRWCRPFQEGLQRRRCLTRGRLRPDQRAGKWQQMGQE